MGLEVFYQVFNTIIDLVKLFKRLVLDLQSKCKKLNPLIKEPHNILLFQCLSFWGLSNPFPNIFLPLLLTLFKV